MDGTTADDILNLDEASRYLRIKRRTLYTLAARGVVPAAKIGGQWRFRRTHLDGLFESDQDPRTARSNAKLATDNRPLTTAGPR
jgi:excisionase family DNA binding protein